MPQDPTLPPQPASVDPKIQQAGTNAFNKPKVQKVDPNQDTEELDPIPVDINNPRARLIKEVLRTMVSNASYSQLLGGETGLGKTTLIKQLAKMLGFPFIIVEIPHVTEEHLINIPFVVFDKNGNKSQGGTQINVKPELQFGTSYLTAQLGKLSKKTDAEWQAAVNSYDDYLKTLIQANYKLILKVREKYDRLLFLDEFFRQTTPTIRNILRGILAGRIGNDPMPAGTHVIYASNLSDIGGSLDPQSGHTMFFQKTFTAPSKSEWLNFMMSEALGKKVRLKNAVINAFNKHLQDEHISYTDTNLDLRISPRRWSEILLYINNAYPFKSLEEAGIISTILKQQFSKDSVNRLPLFDTVQAILSELLIKSGLDPKKVKDVPPSEWRDLLANQILSMQEIGEMKKYVPVIQGLPGMGKTAQMTTFEEPPYNMRVITVEAPSLSRDSVVGIPVPDQNTGGVDSTQKKGEELGVQFSEPELSVFINKRIKEANDRYFKKLQRQERSGALQGKTAEEAYQDFQDQKYKYLLFVDEINRVREPAVFNSLRRLILEKEFNDQYKLPEGMLIVAAINPADEGVIEMTSHFRDAIELVDAAPNWKGTLSFFENVLIPGILNKATPPRKSAVETAMSIVEQFPKVFAKGNQTDAKEFYINIGTNTQVYFSPRDYTELLKVLITNIDFEIDEIIDEESQGNNVSSVETNSRIADAAFVPFRDLFDSVFNREQITSPEFYRTLKKWLDSTINITLEKKMKIAGLTSILLDRANGVSKTPLKDDNDFINYMESSAYKTKMYDDMTDFFSNLFASVTDQNSLDDAMKKTELIVNEIADAITGAEEDSGYEREILEIILPIFRSVIDKQVMSKISDDDVDAIREIAYYYVALRDKVEKEA